MVKAQIIATVGPASSNETVIRKMMRHGLDVVRLNFSHGTHKSHKNTIDITRRLNKKYRRHIRILQDLEGYRIRIGSLRGHKPVLLKKRQRLCVKEGVFAGTDKMIPIEGLWRFKDVKPGQFIYIDDGNIILKIIKRLSGKLKTEVVVGGILRENKGVNIPEAHLMFSGMTEKDRRDLEFGIAQKVDYIAQSFVRTKADMLAVKKVVAKRLPSCRLIAKIENRQGVKNLGQIMDVADGIMIARGDLGICVPIYEVPVIQKDIIRQCKKRKKFVITATQMLEHMVDNLWPTRAEVTDVANAVIDGTDFVMLSAETAAGRFPVEAVKMMNTIIKFTEASPYYTSRGTG
ncbi:MAG: pyruvate kinase [Candidatus Omnitrophica bacterium]|nr:pyruvate kinase [Candidatus Omnitrophota bacterium]